MLIDQDIRVIDTIDLDLINKSLDLALKVNWLDEKFNRYETTLVEGRLCTLPYPIRSDDQKKYSLEQEQLINSVMPIVKKALESFPDLVPVRGEVVNLLPGKALTPHIDIYWFHKHSKRIHIPLCTNDQCAAMFEERSYHLKPGIIYEINNRITHWAENKGTQPRIHIILDLMPLLKFEELKSDRSLALKVE